MVVSASQGEVVFDAGIYDAIRSNGFWDYDTANLEFTENSYNESTGIHQIEVD